MAREIKILCGRCDARLGAGPYCPKCGYPTPHASHEDRVDWELRQWAAANPAATVASTPMNGVPAVEVVTKTRRWFKSRNGNRKLAQAANGSGHAAPEGTNGNGNGHVDAPEEISPFEPPPDAENTPSVKTPTSKPAPKRAKPTPEKAATAPSLEPEIEHPEGPTAEPRTKTIRSAHRLPSLADIEAAAKQGPSMVKILRLIQLRVAVLDAQIDAVQTG